MNRIFDEAVKDILNQRLEALEEHLEADVIFFYGEIQPSVEKTFRDFIENLKKDTEKDFDRLAVMLNTPGGSAETVEKMVNIIRQHYSEVYFIVPDYAMSAGTIFCLSGDKIFMDYSSSLGPIDPQVFNGQRWVPALGYLDKVNEMIEKSRLGTLTQAEFIMLQKLDLAEIRQYESAKALTVSLLKEWLVKYKFKNWTTHGSNGKPVTATEKEERAEAIAKYLGDNSLWHSHGRSIGIKTLTELLKLKIDDYSDDLTLRTLIRSYNDLICEYIVRHSFPAFAHSRIYF